MEPRSGERTDQGSATPERKVYSALAGLGRILDRETQGLSALGFHSQPRWGWNRLLIQGPGDWDADISFDNFRVVPKKS